MFINVLVIVASYLVGSFSFANFICKNFYHIDIMQHGSKNPGSTNVLRVIGKRPALTVFAADLLKGFTMVALAQLVGGDTLALLAAVAVVIGHDWSVFLGFKGGKGIATSFGAIIALAPKVSLILLAIGVCVIYAFRYVSLGSITAACLLPLLFLLLKYPVSYTITGFVLGTIAVYRHRDNIRRLLSGKENRIGQRIN